MREVREEAGRIVPTANGVWTRKPPMGKKGTAGRYWITLASRSLVARRASRSYLAITCVMMTNGNAFFFQRLVRLRPDVGGCFDVKLSKVGPLANLVTFV